jgi:O-antigen/teichoic acid export membrane protein
MKKLVLIDQCLFSLDTLATTWLLAKILPIEDFGIYAWGVLVLSLCLNVLNALIVQPMQVCIHATDDPKSYLRFLHFAYTYTSLFLSFVPAILFDISLGVYAFCFFWHDYARKLLLAQSALKKVLQIDSFVLGGHIVMLSIFFVMDYPHFEWIIYAVSLGYIATFGIVTPTLQAKWQEIQPYLPQHSRQSKWLLATAFLQWNASHFFTIMAGIYVGSKAVGAFRLVQSMFGVLNIILQTFENYTLPTASKLLQKSRQEAYSYIRTHNNMFFFLLLPFLMLVWLFPTSIMQVIGGKEYTPYYFVVQGMCVLYLVIFLAYPTRIMLRIELMDKIFMWGYVVSFLFSLLSFQYLLSTWNLLGVVIGLIANQCVMFLTWQYYLNRKIL